MTVGQAISRADAICPQEDHDGAVYEWLNELEARICTELLFTEPTPIDSQSGEVELSAPTAYCEIYPLYIMMKRELVIGESERYSFLANVFNSAYSEYANYTVRQRAASDAVYIKTV